MFRLIIRNILRSRTRSLLSASGIAVCIFVFASLLSLDSALQRMVSTSASDKTLIVFERYKACPPFSRLPIHYGTLIQSIDHVEKVMPVRFLISNCGTTTDLVVLHGVDKNLIRQFRKFDIPDEQYAEFQIEKSGAIIGRAVAEKYGYSVGDHVTLPKLMNVSFTVRGIFDAPGDSLNNVILVDRIYLEQSISDPDVATMFMISIGEKSSKEAVSAAIDSLLDDQGVATRTGPEQGFIADMANSLIELVKFSKLIAMLSLVLLFIAVANSVSMSIRDRIREMALMKLVGFTSTKVCLLVISENSLMGMLSAAIGVVLCFILFRYSEFSVSVEGFTFFPQVTGTIFITSMAAGILLSVGGAFTASFSASRRPIIKSLRSLD